MGEDLWSCCTRAPGHLPYRSSRRRRHARRPLMIPPVRKFALTAHVTASVGWLGSVAAFLVLAIAGLRSADAETIRAAYLAMNLLGWFIIVPLCFASLATGLIQALGTPWGLLRHYWVIIKLLITLLSTIILLVHMRPITHMAEVAAETMLASTDMRRLRIQLAVDAAAAVIALLVATTLSIYKPRGVTRYGVTAPR